MYKAKLRQRIELNAAFELLKQAKTGPYENPVVTVMLRRDGTVEDVTINKSSGLPEIDAAIKRIVMLLAPYPQFPSDLALDWDAMEFTQTWTIDNAVRLKSGGR